MKFLISEKVKALEKLYKRERAEVQIRMCNKFPNGLLTTRQGSDVSNRPSPALPLPTPLVWLYVLTNIEV